MVRLEKIMDEKFPGCGIQSKHIKSKLQVWKKDYGHILGILGSSGGAGASIDPNTRMIVADSESVWSDYVKVWSPYFVTDRRICSNYNISKCDIFIYISS